MEQRNEKRKALLVIIVWAAVIAWSGTTRDWWFEDDPGFYALSAAQASPLPFFVDQALARTGAGNEVVPMLFASFWLDSRIAPNSVAFAYWHTALALLVAALLLRRVGGTAVACAWLLLPSTLAVAEFLSTRCYAEGMIFALLAWRSRWWIVFAALALLSKELFVPSLLTLLGLRFLREHRFGSLVALFALAGAYLAYRIWAVGAHLEYSMPLPTIRDVAWLLAWWPHTLSYGVESYAVAAMIAFMAWRRRRDVPWLSAAIVTLVCFGTLVPVTIALIQSYDTPAPWGRSYFVVNTLFLIALGWLFRQRALAWVVLFVVLMVGASRSHEAWDARKRLNEIEGRFFVEHPDELLMCKSEATWFFQGLARLRTSHAEVVSLWEAPERIAAARRRHERWWWYRGGEMVSVPP